MIGAVEKDRGDRREAGALQGVNHLEEDHRSNRGKAKHREGVDHRSSQGDAVRRDRVTRRDHQVVGKTRVQARVAGLVVSKHCFRDPRSLCERRIRRSYSVSMR